MELINNITKTLRDDLSVEIQHGSKVSIAAACFSIYAFQELKSQLKDIDELRFIFTSQVDNCPNIPFCKFFPVRNTQASQRVTSIKTSPAGRFCGADRNAAQVSEIMCTFQCNPLHIFHFRLSPCQNIFVNIVHFLAEAAESNFYIVIRMHLQPLSCGSACNF